VGKAAAAIATSCAAVRADCFVLMTPLLQGGFKVQCCKAPYSNRHHDNEKHAADPAA
jgi:hypothetical protein